MNAGTISVPFVVRPSTAKTYARGSSSLHTQSAAPTVVMEAYVSEYAKSVVKSGGAVSKGVQSMDKEKIGALVLIVLAFAICIIAMTKKGVFTPTGAALNAGFAAVGAGLLAWDSSRRKGR